MFTCWNQHLFHSRPYNKQDVGFLHLIDTFLQAAICLQNTENKFAFSLKNVRTVISYSFLYSRCGRYDLNIPQITPTWNPFPFMSRLWLVSRYHIFHIHRVMISFIICVRGHHTLINIILRIRLLCFLLLCIVRGLGEYVRVTFSIFSFSNPYRFLAFKKIVKVRITFW